MPDEWARRETEEEEEEKTGPKRWGKNTGGED
jgi:hypothetical protein